MSSATDFSTAQGNLRAEQFVRYDVRQSNAFLYQPWDGMEIDTHIEDESGYQTMRSGRRSW